MATPIDAHEYFTYDGNAGNLVWKFRPKGKFANQRAFTRWNGMYSGKVAGWEVSRRGGLPQYRMVCINSAYHLTHRLIWEMHNGCIPKGMVVDHIDRNPFNNKLSNLRLVTTSQNAMNATGHKANKSGYRGVYKNKNQWNAAITVNYKRIHVGRFNTSEEANAARLLAARKYHGEYAAIP